MAQGSSSRTVVIGDQPVEVDDTDVKDVLIEVLETLREIKDLMILFSEGEG